MLKEKCKLDEKSKSQLRGEIEALEILRKL